MMASCGRGGQALVRLVLTTRAVLLPLPRSPHTFKENTSLHASAA
jgi:hypothetical protein